MNFLLTERQFDADKAAREFGGGKADSFKRQIWVITKRIKDYKGGADEANDEHNNPTTPKSNGSKKRKADATPTTEKSSAKKGRKARSEEAESMFYPLNEASIIICAMLIACRCQIGACCFQRLGWRVPVLLNDASVF